MQPLKEPIWTPYVTEIKILNKTKKIVKVVYKGGEVEIKLDNTLCLLLYGSLPQLTEEIVEIFLKANVPLIYHARNISRATYITGGLRGSATDTLTKQILFREDRRRVRYIARTLTYYKFKGLQRIVPVSPPILDKDMSIERVRNIEAIYTKLYWRNYSKLIGLETFSRRGRDSVTQALDACSKFLSGIILRWVTYHFMSPYHGFLHTQTIYPALVYDLMEPYRYIMDLAVKKTIQEVGTSDSFKVTAVSIENLKKILDQEVYCETTKQYTRRQNLIHGITLALRAYLLGYGRRFLVPVEGVKKGGRPIKTNYTLPGKSAGYSKIYRPSSS